MTPEDKPKFFPPGFWDIWPMLMILFFMAGTPTPTDGRLFLKGLAIFLWTGLLALKVCGLISKKETHAPPEQPIDSKGKP